jgi:soluble lytic murein transglycosylase
LRELAAAQPSERERALLVLGLHHYARGDWEAAEELLQRVADGSDELEGWRLFALADAAARVGDDGLAETAIVGLLQRAGSSPLRGRALVAAAQRSWDRGDGDRALARVALARSQPLAAANRTEIEVLAWRIGVARGDRAVERDAARRLVVEAPARAAALGIDEQLTDEDGRQVAWEEVLTAAELEHRATAWLQAGRPAAAAETLRGSRPEARGLRWHLLLARALTEQGEGDVAYALLAAVDAASQPEAAALEWERARAAADAAVARAGRRRSAAERAKLRALAQRHLRHVVALGVDSASSASALRALYAELADDGRFEDAMEMLRLLRKVDPTDRTGANHLWERGWQEYQRRNFSGAIGYWSQLAEIYPGDRDAHRGTYWKGRAFEELGELRRAHEVYRQVVRDSDTADFYVRQALGRLGGGQAPEQRPGSRSPAWPRDLALRRVLALSNFGLDRLAEVELETLTAATPAPDARDVQALRGILTVRAGKAREGVQLLRTSFPQLGGPFQAEVPQPVLAAYYPLDYADTIATAAARNDLPPTLVAGIVRQESAFDPRAQSWAGARGLMQIMPATAREWAGKLELAHSPERLFDPAYSIQLGSAYFRWVLGRFGGNVELALAGYNGGPNRIKRLWEEAGGDEAAELDLFLEKLAIDESQAYVKRILVLADSYRQLYPTYGEEEGGGD